METSRFHPGALNRQRMENPMSRISWLATTILSVSLTAISLPSQAQSPAVTPLSPGTPAATPFAITGTLNSAEHDLEAAYDSAWTGLNRTYADRDKLPDDWPAWQHKFDGTLHNEADLTKDLRALIEHVGDDQVQLLTASALATINA